MVCWWSESGSKDDDRSGYAEYKHKRARTCASRIKTRGTKKETAMAMAMAMGSRDEDEAEGRRTLNGRRASRVWF
jgi:hypothetical protein